jgi:hypothetical protein
VHATSAFASNAHKTVTVRCPEGKRVLGGGGHAFASLGDANRDRAPLLIRHSEPSQNGWAVIADEFAPYDHNWVVRAVAICAAVAE